MKEAVTKPLKGLSFQSRCRGIRLYNRKVYDQGVMMRPAVACALLAFLCTLSLLPLGGCVRDYAGIPPGQMRAFKIPFGDSKPHGDESAADSTLCLFSVPDDYAPGRSFPLLVALHGGGSSAVLFHRLWRPVTRKMGYVLLTPQGEEPSPEGTGYLWGQDAEDIIRRSIDIVLNRVNINRSRVYVTGFSQGGHHTYAIALAHPRVFAGIAPIGVGYDLPDSAAAGRLDGLRVYIGHGENERGLEAVRSFAASLRARGCLIRLAVYPDTGHGVPPPVSSELASILEYFDAREKSN
jgi:predicted esterase